MSEILLLTLILVLLSVFVASNLLRNRFRKLVRTRYAVTLTNGNGEFAGLLVESNWDTVVFDKCVTIPQDVADSPKDIIGRVHIDRRNIAYLQELPNDHL